MRELSALWIKIHFLSKAGVILGLLTGGYFVYFSLGFAAVGGFNLLRIFRACIVPGVILFCATITLKWPKAAGLILIAAFLGLSLIHPPDFSYMLPPVVSGVLILSGVARNQRMDKHFDKKLVGHETAPVGPDYLVLLHGMGRGAGSLWLLERRLRRAGFEVRNIGYPSTSYPVEELARIVRARVETACPDRQRKINFVTVSLGGIVLRHILAHDPPENLGRVVMLVPPNGGSELADFLMNRWVYRKLMGPAGQQLGTGDSSAPNILPPADFGPGVIAGDKSVLPWFSWVIPGRDDGMVSVERTKVTGMADWIVLPTSHTFVMYNREVARQAAHFLRHGQFDK